MKPQTPEWHGLLMRFVGEKDQTHREMQFQNWLANQLSPYFQVGREVKGQSARSGRAVRIDLMCKARPAVVRDGFTNQVFGIEAKYVLGWKEEKARECSQWAAQMVQYLHSKFWHKGHGDFSLVPAFVLSAPALSTVDKGLKDGPYMLGQIGVGELHFRPRRPHDPYQDCVKNTDYEVVFEIRMKSGLVFWSSTKGRTGKGIGRSCRIDHPDFEREEREYFQRKEQE